MGVLDTIGNAALSGLTGGISSVIGGVGSLFGAQRQYKNNRKLMSYSNQLQKDYFDYTFGKQADYNNPFAQVGRLKSAGINPALALGGNVTNTQSGETATPAAPNSSAPMQNKVDPLTSAQMENVYAETNLKKEQAKTQQEEQRRTRMDGLLKQREAAIRQLDYHIKEKSSDAIIKAYEKQVELLDEQIYKTNGEGNYYHQKAYTETYETQKQFYEVYGSYVENHFIKPLQVQLTKANIDVAKSQAFVNSTLGRLNIEQAETIKQMRPLQLHQLANSINIAVAQFGLDWFKTTTGDSYIGDIMKVIRQSPAGSADDELQKVYEQFGIKPYVYPTRGRSKH